MSHTEIVPLDPDAWRQQGQAVACYAAFEAASAEAAAYSGGMLWKRVKGHDYLVRTSRTGRQTGMGRRSAQTEALFDAFRPAKDAAAARLAGLQRDLERHVRLNRALRVGRVPPALIDILLAAQAALGPAVCVVGDAALLAYESAAGARFDPGLLGLRGARAQALRPVAVTFAIDETVAHSGTLSALSVSAPGVVADWLTRRATAHTPSEYWSDTQRDIQWLANAPRCSHVVVGRNGRMARMPTVDPRALVLHKDWLLRQGTAAVHDIAVGQALEQLLSAHLAQFDFRELAG